MRDLLQGFVDYAGLYPPAALSMADAVAAYHGHCSQAEADLLARFIVPAPRLNEFLQAQQALLAGKAPEHAWPLSVGAGPLDTPLLMEFVANSAPWARVDALETRAGSPDEVLAMVAGLPQGPTIFVEIPLGEGLEACVRAVRQAGACAKVRCGGLSIDQFPSPAQLAAFLEACVRHEVAFKATAGLHHPLRSSHPMNMQPGGEAAVMHGFLNLLLATALLLGGGGVGEAQALLECNSWEAFAVEDQALAWGNWRWTREGLVRLRAARVLSIGSCSFAEPVADLQALGLLPG